MSPNPLHTIRRSSVAGVVVGLAGTIALLYYGRLFLITLTVAVIFAFILEPLVMLQVRVRVPRSVGSLVACGFAGFLLYLAGFGLYNQIANLLEDMPQYRQRITQVGEKVSSSIGDAEQWLSEVLVPKRLQEKESAQSSSAKAASTRRRRNATPAPAFPPPPNLIPEVRIRPERPPILDYLYSHLGSVYEALLMASFIPFLIYFMLSWRNHLQRSFLMLFEEEEGRHAANKSLENIAFIVRMYMVGNFALGLLLTAISSVVFLLAGVPYPFLVGALSGFLSLVPYFGVPLALIPPLLSTLSFATTLTPYIVVISTVAALHLLALNVLYPKLVGHRVHLNPLAVTVAIMFWGAIWGPIGFILAIPLAASIKAVCDNVPKLQAFAKLLGD